MSYKEKPIIKLYKYQNGNFIQQAIIDDYQECSFERNLYQAGAFTITIKYNIPNALLFQRGLFIQFGNDPYDFGEIITISDSIGSDGKGSQIRTITGYDSRYILKRRVIKNMNSNGTWVMTAKGELCIRNLIKDQCGESAEAKRQLPITNTIPDSSSAIGKEYSVSEQFTNLYEVCKTIATQSEIGWRLNFDGASLTLECYEGEDKSQTVQFSTNFDSLANGEFSDSSESYSNAIYVGGKGQNDNRDIYEGEDGTPEGLDRFESWDNQSSMTTDEEYEAEALSMLTQYGQTVTMNGNGLAKCPYIYKEQYNVGDWITVSFSGKSAVVQILSVTEHWSWGAYDIQFSFGKPLNNLSDQLQLMLRKIQSASEKTQATDSVRWYTIPTDTAMPKADVTYNTIGFEGNVGSGATFTLYLDNAKTGSKTYHVYFKQLAGSGKLTLTTGKAGATNLVLSVGTYVAIIYVDENGNVTTQGATATDIVQSGSTQPVESGAVADKIQNITGIASSLPTDSVLHYSFDEVPDYPDGTANVRLIENNTYDIQSGNYMFVNGGGTTFTNNNGKLQCVTESGGYLEGFYIRKSYTNNKVIKMKFKITALSGNVLLYMSDDLDYKTFSAVGEYEISCLAKTVNSNFSFVIRTGNSATVIIDEIYIGDGSYTTPIIDNANGQYQTSQTKGFVAQQGVSGKGVYFPAKESGETRIKYPSARTDKDISISCWVKFDNSYTSNEWLRLILNGNGNYDCGLWRRNTTNTSVQVGMIFRWESRNSTASVEISKNEWHLLTGVYDANTRIAKIYVDGVYKSAGVSIVNAGNQEITNRDYWSINENSIFQGNVGTTTGASYYIDDVLFFNRVLSDTEIQALYQNKANTPKYFPTPTNEIKQDSLELATSGGVFNALENKVNSQFFTIDITKSFIKINCPYNFCYIVVFFGTTVADNSTEVAQGYGNAGVRYSINKIGGTRNSARLQGGSENNRYLYSAIDEQVSSLKIIPLLGVMPTVEFVNTL